jgi:hypothetical protein
MSRSAHVVKPKPSVRSLLPNIAVSTVATNSVKWVASAPLKLVKGAISDVNNRMHYREMERNPTYLARKLAHERHEREMRVYGLAAELDPPPFEGQHVEEELPAAEPTIDSRASASQAFGSQPLSVQQLDAVAATKVLNAAIAGASASGVTASNQDLKVRRSLMSLGGAVQERRELGRSDVAILNELCEKGSVPIAIALANAPTPPARGALDHIAQRSSGESPAFSEAVVNVTQFVASRSASSVVER